MSLVPPHWAEQTIALFVRDADWREAILGDLREEFASRRTQEIGVRMALGASWWHVIRVATTQAVRITVSGVALGGLLAAALGRVMETVLRGGVVSSPWQLGALAGMLAAVALTAAYLPARRAARIDPTLALRAE